MRKWPTDNQQQNPETLKHSANSAPSNQPATTVGRHPKSRPQPQNYGYEDDAFPNRVAPGPADPPGPQESSLPDRVHLAASRYTACRRGTPEGFFLVPLAWAGAGGAAAPPRLARLPSAAGARWKSGRRGGPDEDIWRGTLRKTRANPVARCRGTLASSASPSSSSATVTGAREGIGGGREKRMRTHFG